MYSKNTNHQPRSVSSENRGRPLVFLCARDSFSPRTGVRGYLDQFFFNPPSSPDRKSSSLPPPHSPIAPLTPTHFGPGQSWSLEGCDVVPSGFLIRARVTSGQTPLSSTCRMLLKWNWFSSLLLCSPSRWHMPGFFSTHPNYWVICPLFSFFQ